MSTIGVGKTELRRRWFALIRQVRDGDKIEVTEYGKLVVVISPIPPLERREQPVPG